MGPTGDRAGALLFSRYGHPPNALGFCGPADHRSVLRARTADPSEVLALARGFDAAWPYLLLLAQVAGTGPLDPHVQEAYWLGAPLLDELSVERFERWLEERPALRAAAPWDAVRAQVRAGAPPHHGFHVFSLYPWFWLLRSGHEGRPLQVLDRCRIRWGTVRARDDTSVRVSTRLLAWGSGSLSLGAEVQERAALVPEERPDRIEVGDVVSLHWDLVCDRLTDEQAGELERRTVAQLALANAAD